MKYFYMLLIIFVCIFACDKPKGKFDMSERFKNYPKTDMFQVVNTKTLPHEYTITDKTAGYISINMEGGMTRENIRKFEKEFGSSCGIPDCKAPIDMHFLSLVILVNCSKKEPMEVPGCDEYLKRIHEQAHKDNVSGHIFIFAEEADETP